MPDHQLASLSTRLARRPWRPLSAFAAVATALLVTACGGGGEASTADTGLTSRASSLAYAEGPIAGFGSIVVGGVRYDDSGATLTDEDGNPWDRSALKLGVMVQVDADPVDATALTAMARRIRFGPEVVGPATAVDAAAGTLTVLGQRVTVTASTVFGETLAGGLAAVTAGAVLQVNGFLDIPGGRIVATRIEARPEAARYALRGALTQLDATARTFRIGSETISYASVPRVPPNLANALVVRVTLQTAQVNGQWLAQSLAAGARMPDALAQARIEGVVTAFTSSSSFEVNGVKVDATNANFENGTAAVVLGARLEVVGTMRDGVLVASKVELDEERRSGGQRPLVLHGEIASIDATARTFALRGVTVAYTGTVDYRNGTEATLAVGRRVEVRGVLSADRNRLDARRIDFR
jgi:hypothetical protein